MNITFKSRKLCKIFNSNSLLQKEYGADKLKRIKNRLAVLSAAPNLAHVPTQKPERCHSLEGDRKGQFAVDISHNYRIIFVPDHDPLPLSEDRNLLLENVTCIKIQSVEDYH